MSENEETYTGQCLCGSVQIRVTGPPSAAGICHCETCRTWHASPVNTWAIWEGDAVEITRGETLLGKYDSGRNERHWCSQCGSGLMNRKPDGQTIVYADVLCASGYIHQPICHIHCEESVYDIQDGLPKYLDLPRAWGGSGKKVAEPARTGPRLKEG